MRNLRDLPGRTFNKLAVDTWKLTHIRFLMYPQIRIAYIEKKEVETRAAERRGKISNNIKYRQSKRAHTSV